MTHPADVIQQLSQLLTPDAAPISLAELVDAAIGDYNQLFPEYPVYRNVDEQPSRRRVTPRSDISALLSSVVQQEPSGTSMLIMLLPELKNIRAQCSIALEPLNTTGMLESLQKAITLSERIAQIESSNAYQQYFASSQDIYNAAKLILGDSAELTSFEDFCTEHAYRAHSLSKELAAMKQLQLSPPSEGRDIAPMAHLNDWIVRVSDDTELLEACTRVSPGFTLCATIPDDDPASSYFSLICRSSSRTVLLQDVFQSEYPGQNMHRRTDRRHVARMERSPFPYRLLDLDFSDNERRIHKSGVSTGLSACNTVSGKTIASVREMTSDEILELLICIRLLMADWLSLANDTLAQPAQALLSFHQDPAMLPAIVNRTPIQVPVEQLTLHKLDFTTYAELCGRYGHRAPAGNWVAELFLKEILPTLEDRPLLKSTGTALAFATPQAGQPAAINSERGVLSDLLYLARQSQADLVLGEFKAWEVAQRPLMREFLTTHMLSHKYIVTQLINTNHWKEMQSRDKSTLTATCRVTPQPSHIEFYRNNPYLLGFNNAMLDGDFSERAILSSTYQVCRYDVMITQFSMREPQKDSDYTSFIHAGMCPFSGDPAEIFIEIKLHGAHAVSAFTGVSFDALPPLLKTLGMAPYHGNGILDRLDPLMHENCLRSNRPYSVFLGLSMKMFHQLRAEAGLATITQTELKKHFAIKKNR